jgi:hypothetical protein
VRHHLLLVPHLRLLAGDGRGSLQRQAHAGRWGLPVGHWLGLGLCTLVCVPFPSSPSSPFYFLSNLQQFRPV